MRRPLPWIENRSPLYLRLRVLALSVSQCGLALALTHCAQSLTQTHSLSQSQSVSGGEAARTSEGRLNFLKPETAELKPNQLTRAHKT